MRLMKVCSSRFGLLIAIGAASPAPGSELYIKSEAKPPAAARVYDWTGFYLGGHVGYGGGSFGPGTNPFPEQGVFFPHSLTGLIGGYQAGYNRQFSNRIVVAAEIDISFPSPVDRPRVIPAPFNTSFDYFATARGRIGYAVGSVQPYVTAGAAWARTRVDVNGPDGSIVETKSKLPVGWVAGIGIEYAMEDNWSVKGEYNYVELGSNTYRFEGGSAPDAHVDPRVHAFKLGLNYRLVEAPSWVGTAAIGNGQPSVPASTDWNVHGQTTVIAQGEKLGRWMRFSDGGCGRAASSISIRNWLKVSASEPHSASPASRTAKRRRVAEISPNSGPSDIFCDKRLDLAASRKTSPMRRTNWPESATSIASPSRWDVSRSATILTATPTPRTRALIS
jgi:opacity protein-like surface antigen